jgi:hypothetical protein
MYRKFLTLMNEEYLQALSRIEQWALAKTKKHPFGNDEEKANLYYHEILNTRGDIYALFDIRKEAQKFENIDDLELQPIMNFFANGNLPLEEDVDNWKKDAVLFISIVKGKIFIPRLS